MKYVCGKSRNKTTALILFSLVFALLAAAAAYCIHRFLMDEHKACCEDEDEEDYIDENGVCYTDEKNFVD